LVFDILPKSSSRAAMGLGDVVVEEHRTILADHTKMAGAEIVSHPFTGRALALLDVGQLCQRSPQEPVSKFDIV
jgi:hypothetical protein